MQQEAGVTCCFTDEAEQQPRMDNGPNAGQEGSLEPGTEDVVQGGTRWWGCGWDGPSRKGGAARVSAH